MPKIAYSNFFELQLDESDFGKSERVHFKKSNQMLFKFLLKLNEEGIQAHPDFSNDYLIDNIILASSQSKPIEELTWEDFTGRAPSEYLTWEHCSSRTAQGRLGVMRLVPRSQHDPSSAYWKTIHPDHKNRGGYHEWAVPAGAPSRSQKPLSKSTDFSKITLEQLPEYLKIAIAANRYDHFQQLLARSIELECTEAQYQEIFTKSYKHGKKGNVTTLLHLAVANGYPPFIKTILRMGGDVKKMLASVNASGETPAHIAAASNRKKVLDFFIRLHADPEAKDNRGRTVSDVVSKVALASHKSALKPQTKAGMTHKEGGSAPSHLITALTKGQLRLISLTNHIKLPVKAFAFTPRTLPDKKSTPTHPIKPTANKSTELLPSQKKALSSRSAPAAVLTPTDAPVSAPAYSKAPFSAGLFKATPRASYPATATHPSTAKLSSPPLTTKISASVKSLISTPASGPNPGTYRQQILHHIHSKTSQIAQLQTKMRSQLIAQQRTQTLALQRAQAQAQRQARMLSRQQNAQLLALRRVQMQVQQRAALLAQQRILLNSILRVRSQTQTRTNRDSQLRIARDTQQRIARESQLRTTRESQQRAAREAQLRMARETQLRAAREAQLRAAREAQQRAAREAQQRAAREAQLRAAREAQLRAAREAQQRAAREAQQRAAREAQLRAAREAQQRAAREAQQRAARDAELRAQAAARRGMGRR